MQDKKFWIVAQFEFKEIVRKPSFWLATLFLPILLGVISFVSGYASMESMKQFENSDGKFENIYILDNTNVVNELMLVEPYQKVQEKDHAMELVKENAKNLLVVIPEDFATTFEYEIIYQKDEEILSGMTMPMVINSLLKQSALIGIEDPITAQLLTSDPQARVIGLNKDGDLEEDTFGQYILPIISLAVFFLSVFVSSGFLLQSVSAEKENRMIETMLSIIDKKSLMIGKMVGLVGVVFLQLLFWILIGFGVFILVQNQFDIPIPIDFEQIDISIIPINLFLIFSGFIFFGAIMTGVGAVGTGAQDSKNLSSIFILMAIFPMYLMQILITDPTGKLSQFFTYFPFTSHMILLFRYSLGAISNIGLITGLIVTTIYGILALWIALKLFELGCLMYNRRPSFKEIFSYFRK